MPKKAESKEQANFKALIAKHEQEAKEALERPYGSSSVQLQLFEQYADCSAAAKSNSKRNSYGCTLAEETYARFRAVGYNKTDSWRKSHPFSTASDSTIWSKASKLDKLDKVQARIAFWKEKILSEALMSQTEFYQRVTNLARQPAKEGGIEGLKMIGQIRGEFKADKGLPGSADTPLVISWAGEGEEDKK